MIVKKAGCILVNLNTKKIALVSREDNYSFPKGHLEEGETLMQCAIRETKEETGHVFHIIKETEIGSIQYTTPTGENVDCHYYLAIDDGLTDEEIEEKDKEITVWKKWNDVEKTLSSQNLKELWNSIKIYVQKLLSSSFK